MSNGTGAEPAGQSPQGTGPQSACKFSVDGLSFLDLLYAIPISYLATQIGKADLSRVSPAMWLALAVVLAVVVFSWIGLHKNRSAMTKDTPRLFVSDIGFASCRFIQFIIEIITIGLYFTMALVLKFPDPLQPITPAVPEIWITGLLLCVFATYLVWDLLDLRQAHEERGPDGRGWVWELFDLYRARGDGKRDNHIWCRRAGYGAIVTFFFMLIFGAIFLLVKIPSLHTTTALIVWNIILLILLWAYRVAQDKCGNNHSPEASPSRCPRWPSIKGRGKSNMPSSITQDVRNLCTIAQGIATSAYAKYSEIRVGAALATAGGTYKATNVENASYGLSLCAERAAIAQAVAAGQINGMRQLAIACIDADAETQLNESMPCGACRQWFAEFAPDLPVFLIDKTNRIFSFNARELLPIPFAPRVI